MGEKKKKEKKKTPERLENRKTTLGDFYATESRRRGFLYNTEDLTTWNRNSS